MERIKVAVLGMGAMGQTHVESLRASLYVAGLVGYEPDPQRCQQRASELGIPGFACLEDILADDSVRMVTIAAPNHAHKSLAIAAMRAGKAVLCEKPMGQTLEEANEILRVAHETGAFLQIGFELRYSKLYQLAHQWIRDGLIGEPLNIQCRYYCSEFHLRNSWRNRSNGTLVIEKLSHYLDLMRWWKGQEPTSVYAASAPNFVPYFTHPDNHQTIITFEDGSIGVLNFIMGIAETSDGDPLVDLVTKQSDDGHYLQYNICGTKGAIETDVFRRRIRRWEFTEESSGIKSRIVNTQSFDQAQDTAHFHNVEGQNQRVVELVAKGCGPDHSATDAFETMRLCFAVEAAGAQNRLVAMDDLTASPKATALEASPA